MLHMMKPALRAADGWAVQERTLSDVRPLIERHHYSGGCANTASLAAALVDPAGEAVGAALWMAPAAGAAKWVAGVTGCDRAGVLTLSRMCFAPKTPRNAASFTLARCLKILRRDPRWHVAVTYADPMEGHDGLVYQSSGWTPAGEGGARFRWTDADGVMRSSVCAGTLTVAEMRSRGWTRERCPAKPRFLTHISRRYRRAVLRGVASLEAPKAAEVAS